MKSTTSRFAAAVILASVLPASSATVIHSWDFEGDFLDDVGAAEGSLTGSTTVGTTTGHDGGTAAVFQHSVSGPAGSAGVLGTNGTVNPAHTAGSPTIATPIGGFSSPRRKSPPSPCPNRQARCWERSAFWQPCAADDSLDEWNPRRKL